MVDGGQFIVRKVGTENYEVTFGDEVEAEGNNVNITICNASLHLFIVSDLKFYAQILGHENMSSSWCMWCKLSPSPWKIAVTERDTSNVPVEEADTWTIDNLKAAQLRTVDGALKKPCKICGVVDYPLWDFVEVSNYIFPILHAAEIGLGNDCLDAFLDFVDDRVESLSNEEKIA